MTKNTIRCFYKRNFERISQAYLPVSQLPDDSRKQEMYALSNEVRRHSTLFSEISTPIVGIIDTILRLPTSLGIL
jgi:hypothetical protein